MWCVCVSCMCLVPPGVPLCVAGFYDHPVRPGTPARPATPSLGCVSHSPLHTVPCVCGPRAFVRACSPPAPLRSACVWVPACARPRLRVPDSPARAPGAASCRPTGIPRVRPGAPGGRPRGAHCRGWTHRPTRRWEEGGGGGGGERGHVTETDRRAGGRRRPRVRAGAGAPPPPPPPPAHGLGSPRPARSRRNAISRAGASGPGGFSGRVLERRGGNAAAAPVEVSEVPGSLSLRPPALPPCPPKRPPTSGQGHPGSAGFPGRPTL
ncbi:nanos homolog 3 isoform X2 [Trachypithecus francoisi]|uniref:nanos homolog 3 isoform X2 n=1 Tax=Trachypithecus francoisi TaxID=54180 RepID=UPI00141B5EF3|nr:nanos homolog 3 isoform X2 [Trachypithecus francoisi]